MGTKSMVLCTLFNKLTLPRSVDADARRQEYILNVLLLGCILLSIIGVTVYIAVSIGVTKPSERSIGAPIEIVLAAASLVLILFFLSRAGLYRLSATILIVLSLLTATYISFSWRADAPLALLLYALTIIIGGILVSSRLSFALTGTSFLIMSLIAELQSRGILYYDKFWATEATGLNDTLTASATLLIIAIASWLSNREIERSLKRARRSEAALKKERDLLEVEVEKRTKELKQVQLERMVQLYRFAKFGRLASGLLHDLVNPLTDISLNLERLGTRETSTLFKRALGGVKRMKSLVGAARRQIQKQEIETGFSAPDEIKQAIQMLAYKAKEEGVEIRFPQTGALEIYGNPLKFYQLVTNLLSNAIDAYEKIDRKKRQVFIELKKTDGKIRLTVQDWGCGIARKHLGKIFDPFFTTKGTEEGVGIGLCICKDIAEKDFGGKITIKSEEGKGSTFTVELPIRDGKTLSTKS